MSSRHIRMSIGVLAFGLAAGVMTWPLSASAEVPAPEPDLLTEVEAIVLARQTGEPVVVSSLTDERTLVTADPVTGELTAELSAGVARVPDDDGGWREPSASLVLAPDGTWVTEASLVPVRVSAGGAGAFLTLGEDGSALTFEWPESLPAPTIDDNVATFAEVAPGVDLVVRAAVDGAESFLMVKDAEAAQDPLVRSVPITLAADELTAAESEDGVVSYTDAAGEEQFWVPRAYLWDSNGQPADATVAELLEPGEGSRVEELPVVVDDGASGEVVFDAETSVAEVLDDPATVYPVVIDPSATGTQAYAVRVTEDFDKHNSDIGSEGKLGYNGWTSPYYKSRMYYQFEWPLLNGVPVAGGRINSAEFSYVQTHSPQHDCSNTTFGPSVKLQFHNMISSSTKWSLQPALHSDSGSVSSDYAVGSASVCGKTYTQKWNVSTMVKAERRDYPSRATVTVGLRSADEGDKNGWRHYKHSSGSPKLTIVYQVNPSLPTALTVSSLAAGYLTSLTPTLTATVALPTGSTCVASNCLRADFEVVGPSGAVAAAMESGPAASGTSVAVTVPSGKLADHTTYTVRVKARSVDHGGSSGWVQTTVTTRLNIAPPAATGIAPVHATGGVATGSNPSIATRTPRLQAKMPSGGLCPGIDKSCLTATFTLSGKSSLTLVKPDNQADTLAEVEVPAVSQLALGKHTLTVKVCKEWSPTVCSTASSEFTVVELPKPTIVADPVVNNSTITIKVTTTGAGVVGYEWNAAWGDPAEVVSDTIETQCVTNCSLTFTVPERWSGTALVRVRALGGKAPNTYPGAISDAVSAVVNPWG